MNIFRKIKTIVALQYRSTSFVLIFIISSCEVINQEPDEYFKKSEKDLISFISIISNKENISYIRRVEFLGLFHKFIGIQEISFRIKNYNSDLELDFKIKENFQNQTKELQELIFTTRFESSTKNKSILLDSSMNYFQLNNQEIILIFEKMKDLNATLITRFKVDPASIAFRIHDRFYIIYSMNISELKLENNKKPRKLVEDWYYYNGVL